MGKPMCKEKSRKILRFSMSHEKHHETLFERWERCLQRQGDTHSVGTKTFVLRLRAWPSLTKVDNNRYVLENSDVVRNLVTPQLPILKWNRNPLTRINMNSKDPYGLKGNSFLKPSFVGFIYIIQGIYHHLSSMSNYKVALTFVMPGRDPTGFRRWRNPRRVSCRLGLRLHQSLVPWRRLKNMPVFFTLKGLKMGRSDKRWRVF